MVMEMPGDLRERTALVTGGAKRVGRAIALRLAREGVNVVLTYLRSAGEAEATRKDIESLGVKAFALRADVSDVAACERLSDEATRLAGRIDILVNNASEFPRSPIADIASGGEAFERTFRYLAGVHMAGPLFLGSRLGLAMKVNGWGRIVNLLDRVVVRGQAYGDWAVYLATKYGLYGINQVLARELAPEVTVNGIAPGMVIAPETFTPEETEKIIGKIPLRRQVGVDEIAEDVLHLVRSSSKTGSVLLTDGGSGLRTF
jgi:pteridine reductase